MFAKKWAATIPTSQLAGPSRPLQDRRCSDRLREGVGQEDQ